MGLRKTRAFSILAVSILTVMSHAALAGGKVPESLARYLALDRFTYYTSELASRLAKQGKHELAASVAELTPERAQADGIASLNLTDAETYDEVVIDWLRQKKSLSFKDSDVRWGYHFLKRKLNEAYRVASFEVPEKAKSRPPVYAPVEAQTAKVPEQAVENLTLDADRYMSNRTTRAVFWEANATGRPVEFHLGSVRQFQENLNARGGRIVGEVKTVARNYNKIYLVQFPGDSEPHYAISEISGGERLDHLLRQLKLGRLGGKTAGAQAPPVRVFGSVERLHAEEQTRLTRIFEVLPKADRVVIGQKAAIESAIRDSVLADQIVAAYQKNRKAVSAKLNAQQLQMIEARAKANGAVAPVPGSLTAWEKIHSTLGLPEAPKPETFDLVGSSHDMADVVLTTGNGKKVRWRLISNMWGDEVAPVARALKATGHTDVIYAGTAGALPGSGLKVGDLVVPSEAVGTDGKARPLFGAASVPDGAKRGGSVAHVGSPYQETQEWLARTKKEGASLVELETAHLAEIFSGPNDRLQVFLQVSDEVASKHATLAEARSSTRDRAQNTFLSHLFSDGGVTTALPSVAADTKVDQAVIAAGGKRDIASLYQLRQLAHQLGKKSPAALAELAQAEQSFTTELLETRLLQIDRKLKQLSALARERGVVPSISVPSNLLDGTWNPRKDQLSVTLSVENADAELELKRVLDEFLKSDPASKKMLELRVTRGPPPPKSISALDSRPAPFLDLYRQAALRNWGLVASETRTGGLKFTRAPMRDPQICPSGQAACSLQFFEPDEATRKALALLDGKATHGRKLLRSVIEAYNVNEGVTRPIYRFSEVPTLPGGKLAEIDYEFTGGKFTVHLKVTPEGAENPLVVAEELAHLFQIEDYYVAISSTGLGYTSKADGFSDHSQWAETVWNAKAGDAKAKKFLAEIEVKAQSFAQKILETPEFRYKLGVDTAEGLAEALAARRAHAEALLLAATKEVKLQTARAQKAWKARKESFDTLEARKEKLNDLVAKNDRKGVRSLLEQYLPWELMTPSERVMWTQWLEAIEHPDPGRSRILYRGMDDDLVMRNAEGKAYTLSKVLTSNQGNYTRRLRSLEASREKIAKKFEFPGDISLEYLLKAHADEPYASQFISYSVEPGVALRFGSKKAAIVKVDERRLVPNIFSRFGGEFEYLAPVILFPDEVVHYQEVAKEYLRPLPGTATLDDMVDRQRITEEFAEAFLAKAREIDPMSAAKSSTTDAYYQEGNRWFERLLSVDPSVAPKGPVFRKGCEDVLKRVLESLAGGAR